jgi:hypothetical protein
MDQRFAVKLRSSGESSYGSEAGKRTTFRTLKINGTAAVSNPILLFETIKRRLHY